MVLINDKKFACGTCIKGHRVSGCTHTDRPLFEIKKKGRPSTQCQCCKDRRKGNSVHNTCVCGNDESVPPAKSSEAARESGNTSQPLDTVENVETRKGQPGSSATFPNGLRDVHEINAAVEALTGFAEDPMRSAERSVQNLLNPCTCKHNGICKCCMPKRAPRKNLHAHTSSTQSHSSGSRTPDGVQSHTERLVELLKANAPTSLSSRSSSPNPSPVSPTTHYARSSYQHLPVPDISPSNPHHPAHTSRHVHKTKLYSPYSHSAASRQSHSKRESLSRQGATSPRPHLPLRPLGDMHAFLDAIFHPDGSVATQISRAALGLPGIHSFDEVADQGGVKSEPMDWEESFAQGGNPEDVDMPLAFPTSEDVTIGACTCGEDCRCPGCVTHPNTGDHNGEGTTCADSGCKSCFDCTDHLHIPAGMTSIEQLLATAAANVPPPIRNRPNGLRPLDISVAPPSASFSPESAANSGFVHLKPLECCNGRCQCRPGECVCEKDCCGCCVRCACGEDAATPTADTFAAPEAASGGCCAASNPAAPVAEKASCCETGKTSTPRLSLSMGADSLAPPSVSPNGTTLTPPRLSPSSAAGFQFNPSPYHSPLLGPSSSSGGSNHHSPMLSATYYPTSSHSSPRLSAGQISPAFNFEGFNLPDPGMGNDGIDPSMIMPSSSSGNAKSQSNSDGPTLRRATSISGHAHTQSTSSTLSGRRATVTATSGASIQRSASTGKQASKALALHQPANHPHVRTIAPKPATLLAPPKSGASSSSRGTSPVGRRRSTSSSHHSRAASPGPSDPSAAGQQRYGHSSVDHTSSSAAYMPLQSLPIVTTSAPDETSQQVSFDPALSAPAGMDDVDITALLQQLTGETGFEQGLQDPGLDQGQMGSAEGEFFSNDFTFDQNPQSQSQNPPMAQPYMPKQPSQEEMFQFLARSLSQGQPSDFGNFVPPPAPRSASDSVQYTSAGNGQNGYNFDSRGSSNYGGNGNGNGTDLPDFDYGNSGPSQPSQPPQTADQTMPFPGFFPGMPTYFPSYPTEDRSRTQSQNGQNPPSFPSASTGQNSAPNGQINPDLIDLSKPLNADHLERIIKALQIQQAQSPMNGAGSSVHPALRQAMPSSSNQNPNPNSNTMPPPPLPQHNQRRSAEFQQNPMMANQFPSSAHPPDTNSSFDPSILNHKRAHQPSFSISSFDSFLAPPPSDSSGSGSGHSTLLSGDAGLMFATEGEDVFDRYIQDNPGEGLDLSALDLGNGSGKLRMGMDDGGSQQVGEEGEQFGLRMEDWVWNNDEGGQ